MTKLQLTRLQLLLLVTVCLTAFLFRIEYIRKTEMVAPIRADALQYVIYGFNLVNYGVFSKESPLRTPNFSSKTEISSSKIEQPRKIPISDSFRSPGYPLLIALSIVVAGKTNFYIGLLYIQALLGSLTVLITYFIARKLLEPKWAMCGTILVALSPHMISMGSYLLTETLFSFLLHGGILFFIYALDRQSYILFIISGLFFGSAYLTNETLFFLPFIFAIIASFLILVAFKQSVKNSVSFKQSVKNSVSFKQSVKKLLIFLVIFSLFPVVWGIRNYINIPANGLKGSSRALATMTHGTYPDFIYKNPKYQYSPYLDDPEQPLFSSSLTNFTKILWKRVKERPFRYASWYLVEKPYYLWSWSIVDGQGDIYVYQVKKSLYDISQIAGFTKKVFKLIHIPFILLMFYGFALLLYRCWNYYRNCVYKNELYKNEIYKNEIYKNNSHQNYYFVFATMIYYTLLYTIFAPWPRYSVPLRPEFYLCAIWTLYELSIKIYLKRSPLKRL